MSDSVTVTQADREVAADFCEEYAILTTNQSENMRAGENEWDNHFSVLAFARHRIQAQAPLVEALRMIAEVDDDGWTSDGHERCTEAALRALKEAGNG